MSYPGPIAALYVDRKGPYFGMPGVECWDIERNATTYDGPYPVIAHPPCAHWGNLAQFAKTDDKHLALIAIGQIMRFGGVLEHPKGSRLWKACGLPLPGQPPSNGMFTIEVNQCDWGHKALKPTWLLFVRVPFFRLPSKPPPRRPTHAVGSLSRNLPNMASAERKITPPDFARWLVQAVREINQ